MYTKPEMNVEQFEVEDILTTSTNPEQPTTPSDPFETEEIPISEIN